MNKVSQELQIYHGYLQAKGLNRTPQRQLILEVFLAGEGHRSVEDIYQMIRKKDKRIGYTTVYRAMKLLTDCGLAREIDLADGVTRYEHLYQHEHHDHLICTNCGKSIEFFDADIERVQDLASVEMGFHVLDHELQIYGHCKNCLTVDVN